MTAAARRDARSATESAEAQQASAGLLLVPVIAVANAPLDPVHHESEGGCVEALELAAQRCCLLPRRLVQLAHDDHALHLLDQWNRIGQEGDRGRIEHDEVVVLPGLHDELSHLAAFEKLCRV